jgi:hypothetical protein
MMYRKFTNTVLISVMKMHWMMTPTALPMTKAAEIPIMQMKW